MKARPANFVFHLVDERLLAVFKLAAMLLAAVLLFAAKGLAQSALDGFDPGANQTVFALATQADGKILVGGNFTMLGGGGTGTTTRNHIARLNPDGTLDISFDPGANNIVRSLVVQADGKILVGGDFTTLGGGGTGTTTRNFIGRLNADGTLDPSFDPGANNSVLSLAVQADDKILVGGSFTTFGGGGTGTNPRNRLARLNPDGTLDIGFDPGANAAAFALALQADGKILVGGNFTTLGGGGSGTTTRNRLARLNPDGALDLGFDPGASDIVETLAVQADGRILVGGFFTGLGGGTGTTTRNRIGRLNPDGMLDATFDPGANSIVFSLALQTGGKILVSGDFTTLGGGGTGTTTRNHIGRLNLDGTLDLGFDPGANGDITALAVQPDGRILAGGFFNTFGGGPRNNIGRLQPNGTLEVNFDPGASGSVVALAVQGDGRILVGGVFNTLGGGGTGTTTRNFIGRLNPDGTLDTTFDPGANGQVSALRVQGDGKILVGGLFTTLGGGGSGTTTRNRIGRLNPDGTIDASFDPGANNTVDALAVQADDKILVGGLFSTLGGGGTGTTTRNRIGRLNPDGMIDPSFDPGANGQVLTLAMQADGKILVGGFFGTLGGGGTGTTTRNNIGRLNPDGTIDISFDPGANSFVQAVTVQASGEILVGGQFTTLGGGGAGQSTRNFIGRLNGDGTLDTFDPGANAGVFGLAAQADGKILVGGNFATLGGGGTGTTTRNFIGRLSNPGAALQKLALDPTGATITWNRGVASPEVDRVTFELSTDAINFGALPNPGRIAGGWQLTGQSLPIQQNIFIRARGFYATGFNNGSGSIVESLRNAFITLAPVITSPLSATTTIGQPFSYQITATNSPTLFDATGLPAGVIVDKITGLISGTPSVLGTFPINLSATNAGGTGTAVLTLQVNPPAPVITSPLSATATVGQAFSYQITATNAPTSFDAAGLPTGLTVDTSTGLISGTPSVLGTFFVGLSATNAGGTGSAVLTLTVNPSAPVITSPLSATATLGQAFAYQITATNSPTSFDATGLPAPFTVDTSTGLISGTPTATGTFSVSLSATNAGGTGSATLTLTINPPAPVITSSLTAPATLGQPFAYQITATNSPTSFNATGGVPPGVTVNTVTGLLSGTPSLIGTFLVNLSATNAGGTGAALLTIEVTPPTPVITSPLSAKATVGQQFIYQILATQSPTSFDATNLPAGLVVDKTLGIISGFPSQTGNPQVTLSASNGGGTGTAVLNLTVQAVPASISIISNTSATGRTGSPFGFQVITSGATSAARLSATGLPSGLSLDPVTGLISGTPTADGSFSVSLTVTDGSLTATATLELTFTSDPTVPVIVSPSSASLTPGQPFTYQIIAPSSDTSDPVTFFLIGTLPSGLTFDSVTGTISGTFKATLGFQPAPKLSGGIVTNVQLGATNSHGTTTIPLVFFLAPTGPQNISTRLAVGTDFDVLIGGFIITGNAPKKVVIRAIGPSLPVMSALQDTTLELHSGPTLLGSNDNWRDTQEQEIIATTIPPTNDLESAIVATLEPGAYTAIVDGKNNSTGVGLVEIYDLGTASLDVSSQAQLVNISTRGKVQTADNVMIGGFILSGSTANVLVRAIGPELTASGVVGALQDTTLELHNSSGALLASNDDWETTQKQEIIDTTVPPTDPRESAIVSSLAPGAYTAIVQGKNGTTGVALVEAYLLP